MKNDLGRFLSRKEAATWLGLKPGTLATWALDPTHELNFYKVGGRVYYELSDLKEFLTSRKCR